MARRPGSVWAAQIALQPVEALERERHLRADVGRPGRRARLKGDCHD
nr:hypothetical protein [Ruegeria arenilitoris]